MIENPYPDHLHQWSHSLGRKCVMLLFLPALCFGQEYVDLVKLNYSETFYNKFKDAEGNTNIEAFDAKFTIPIPINEKHAFVTGADFVYNNLQLFPYAERSSLYSTTLKLGMASSWNHKWSTTVVLLPKLASDYKQILDDDLYIGGLAMLKYGKKKNFLYRIGIYGSQEAFGFFTTPIVGFYYLSPNSRFEMDMSLPITADVNYNLGIATLGIDYSGISRSFKIHPYDSPILYADVSSMEFSGYVQFNIVKNRILCRSKLGYSNNKFDVYRENDRIDLGISAFEIGGDRHQLNPSLKGSLFFKFEMLYRFQIPISDPTEKR